MRRLAIYIAALAAASILAAVPAAAQDKLPEETPAPAEQATTEAEAPQRPSAEEELAVLMEALRDPQANSPEKIEERIVQLWSISASETANYLLGRGREAMQAENFNSAIDHLSALLDHAPDFAEGWNVRATAFFMLEEYGLALSDIEHVLALNPQHFGALAGLGIILEQTGKPEVALRALRESQRLNPHNEAVRDAILRLEPKVDGRSL